MEQIELKTSMPSTVYAGGGAALEILPGLLEREGVFLLTDSNVNALYADFIKKFFGGRPAFVFPAGEESKNEVTLFEIIKKMSESGLDRKSVLFALGGGVTGDIGGLAASLYMRGIECVQIPTTLLAQVDSSVGGKTAVDVGGIKNIAGAFYQPKTVVIDGAFLKTLPERELRCGLGEVVKTAALNADLFRKIYRGKGRLCDLAFLAEIVADCVRHKAYVVENDERELSGLRKTLNLGHTTGHAAEMYLKTVSHGECVAIGMLIENRIALKMGIIDAYYKSKLDELLTEVTGALPELDAAALTALALHDKKNADGKISVIVPVREGETKEIYLTADEYCKMLEEAL